MPDKNPGEQRMSQEAAILASEVVKRHAKGNQVALDISQETLDSLLDSWRKGDPSRPAEITFVVEGREVGNLKIAACAYFHDTCCA